MALLALVTAGPACRSGRVDPSGPRTTADLRAQWDQLLRCGDAASCLAAVDRARYMLDTDRQRMAARIAGFGAPAVPVVATAASNDGRPRQREVATLALTTMGPTALAWARDHDDAQGFRVLVHLALHTTELGAARPLLAERLPRQREWLRKELRGAPRDAAHNAGLALLRLLGPEAVADGEALCDVAEGPGRRDWEYLMNAAEGIGWTGARACAPALARALDVPSWRVATVLLQALARLGADDGEVRSRVLRVATSHWSQQIRWRAVTTLRFLREPSPFDEAAAIQRAVAAGQSFADYLATGAANEDPIAAAFGTLGSDPDHPEAAPACAAGRTFGASVKVRDQERTITLQPLGAGTEQRRREQGAKLPPATLADLGAGLDVPLGEALRDVVPLGTSLLVATCAGERGGGVLALPRTGRPHVLHRGCFERVLAVGPDRSTLWLFEGPSHLGATYGRIWRVEREGPTPELVPVVDLPGNVLAVGRAPAAVRVATTQGDVAVALGGELRPLGCSPP